MRQTAILSIFAIVVFAFALASKTDAPTLAAANASGGALYAQDCASCHGATGEGVRGIAPALARNPAVIGNTKGVIRIMLMGKAGPVTERGMTWEGSMPLWQGVLSNVQIAEVITYVRASWGNHASLVTPSAVQAEVPAAVGALPELPATTARSLAGARQLYALNCASCHGANGQGAVGIAPPLARNPDVTGEAQKVISAVVDGSAGPITQRGVTWNGAMPPWRGTITDKGLADLITHIRNTWGNHASAVTVKQVTTR